MFPVVDVGVAARRVFARYFAADGDGIAEMLVTRADKESIQLEHLLAAVHTGSRNNHRGIMKLRDWIMKLNIGDSFAIRSIAKRMISLHRNGPV